MKRLFIIILTILFIGLSNFAMAREVAPSWMDRFEVPKESIVDPFVRENTCFVSHQQMYNYCYEIVKCEEGTSTVSEYAVLMEGYTSDFGEGTARS